MKRFLIHTTWIIFIAVVFVTCTHISNSDFEKIKSTYWIYSDGYRIADFIKFDSTQTFSLHKDTIYFKNNPKAIITDFSKSNFNLQIKSLETGKIGNYMDERGMYE